MGWIKSVTLILIVLTMAACGASNGGEGDVRIISLMPSNTEIIAELGLSGQLVAVTTEDDHPESIAEDETLARLNTFELDEEQLIGLDPSHIVAHGSSAPMHQEILDRVAETTGAEVLVVEEAEDIEGVYDSIRQIGEFLGVRKESEGAVSDIAQEMGNLKQRYSDEKMREAFIHISDQPEIYTAGAGTFIDDALSWINVGNVFDDMEGYPAVSAEDVVARDPGLLVSMMGLEDEVLQQSISDTPGFEALDINAPANQCNIDPDLISRPGPRIVEGLEKLGQCVYE